MLTIQLAAGQLLNTRSVFFSNFIDIALFNSFVLYKLNTDKLKTRRKFIVDIVDSLTETAPSPIAGPSVDSEQNKI